MELITPFGKVRTFVNHAEVAYRAIKLKRSVGCSYAVTDRYLVRLSHTVLSKGSTVAVTLENLNIPGNESSNKRLTAQTWFQNHTMLTIGVADYQEFNGELLRNGIEKYCDGQHMEEKFILAWKIECEADDLATRYAADAGYTTERDLLRTY